MVKLDSFNKCLYCIQLEPEISDTSSAWFGEWAVCSKNWKPLPSVCDVLSLLLQNYRQRCSPLASTQRPTDSAVQIFLTSKKLKKTRGSILRQANQTWRRSLEEAAVLGTPLRKKSHSFRVSVSIFPFPLSGGLDMVAVLPQQRGPGRLVMMWGMLLSSWLAVSVISVCRRIYLIYHCGDKWQSAFSRWIFRCSKECFLCI